LQSEILLARQGINLCEKGNHRRTRKRIVFSTESGVDAARRLQALMVRVKKA